MDYRQLGAALGRIYSPARTIAGTHHNLELPAISAEPRRRRSRLVGEFTDGRVGCRIGALGAALARTCSILAGKQAEKDLGPMLSTVEGLEHALNWVLRDGGRVVDSHSGEE